MVDFKKLAEERYARSTPQERARIDAHRAEQRRYDETRQSIDARFVRSSAITDSATPSAKTSDHLNSNCWTKSIDVRIEDGGSGGRDYEVIRFIGGPTGHESYRLDEDFVSLLVSGKWARSDRLLICCGGGAYDSCEVSTTDVLDYIRSTRPHLFGTLSHLPARRAVTW